ncbi:N-acetylmuramoyl-L-alanine amidase [Candidatus Epulonipiscioides gigas]|nr:N-acetylmuramoyl-L-alanine amidase [Epulopiscium sp. SCG-C07WGA-EpuloA2]
MCLIFISVMFFNISAIKSIEQSEQVTQESPPTSEPIENEFIVCIDPGHQQKGDSKQEPIAPGSTNKKARVSSGTSGVSTKKPEHTINLEASIILKQILENDGIKVVMTREVADVNISNAERAQISNEVNADITIRIHCDSINNPSKTGATILIPSDTSNYTKAIYEESQKFAKHLKTALADSGIKVNGIFKRDDMTGFNWSQVPVIILEMGFMSNWNEDQMLANPAYQKKLMEAVAVAIKKYKQA